jgi:hypothetical protein
MTRMDFVACSQSPRASCNLMRARLYFSCRTGICHSNRPVRIAGIPVRYFSDGSTWANFSPRISPLFEQRLYCCRTVLVTRGSMNAVLVELAYTCMAWSSTLPLLNKVSTGIDGMYFYLIGAGGFFYSPFTFNNTW